ARRGGGGGGGGDGRRGRTVRTRLARRTGGPPRLGGGRRARRIHRGFRCPDLVAAGTVSREPCAHDGVRFAERPVDKPGKFRKARGIAVIGGEVRRLRSAVER